MTKRMNDEEFEHKFDEWWSKSNNAGKDHIGQMILIADVMRHFKNDKVDPVVASKILDLSLRCFHAAKIMDALLTVGKLCKEFDSISPTDAVNLIYDESLREYNRVQPLFQEAVKSLPGWSDKDLAPRHEPEVEAILKRKEQEK